MLGVEHRQVGGKLGHQRLAFARDGLITPARINRRSPFKWCSIAAARAALALPRDDRVDDRAVLARTCSMKSARFASCPWSPHRVAQVLLEEARAGARTAGCRWPRRSARWKARSSSTPSPRSAALRRSPAARGASPRPAGAWRARRQAPRSRLPSRAAARPPAPPRRSTPAPAGRTPARGAPAAAVTYTPEPWRETQQARATSAGAPPRARRCARRHAPRRAAARSAGGRRVAGAPASICADQARGQAVGQPLGDQRASAAARQGAGAIHMVIGSSYESSAPVYRFALMAGRRRAILPHCARPGAVALRTRHAHGQRHDPVGQEALRRHRGAARRRHRHRRRLVHRAGRPVGLRQVARCCA